MEKKSSKIDMQIVLYGILLNKLFAFYIWQKKPELIPKFIGKDIKDKFTTRYYLIHWRENIYSDTEHHESRDRIVSHMAKEIDENRQTNLRENFISLSDIYHNTSELMHNSYCWSWKENVIQRARSIESETPALNENQIYYLLVVIKRFMKVYRSKV